LATYAVGDVQGCYDSLRALLEKISFQPDRDRLWLAGDLVNRGPDSLKVLRFVRELGESAIVVLGNHDLYLLRVALCESMERKRDDSLSQVLNAPDRDELLDWLRNRPLFHVADRWAMVHAGLLPGWSVAVARALAAEVERRLRGDDAAGFLAGLWGNVPDNWHDSLRGIARLRVIVNAMTRMRFCDLAGRMDLEAKGGPDCAPRGYFPWFLHPERLSTDHTVVCGHWSALGLHLGEGIAALDTGCVWGGSLTALRLEDRKIFQVGARDVGVAQKRTSNWKNGLREFES